MQRVRKPEEVRSVCVPRWGCRLQSGDTRCVTSYRSSWKKRFNALRAAEAAHKAAGRSALLCPVGQGQREQRNHRADGKQA